MARRVPRPRHYGARAGSRSRSMRCQRRRWRWPVQVAGDSQRPAAEAVAEGAEAAAAAESVDSPARVYGRRALQPTPTLSRPVPTQTPPPTRPPLSTSTPIEPMPLSGSLLPVPTDAQPPTARRVPHRAQSCRRRM